MFSGVFTAEQVDGVGNRGSGDTTVGGQTIVEANMSLKPACLTDDALSGQKRNFQFWDHSEVLNYQNFQTSDVTLKDFCCPIFVDKVLKNFRKASPLCLLLRGPQRESHIKSIVSILLREYVAREKFFPCSTHLLPTRKINK
jgi:hypothetical protein